MTRNVLKGQLQDYQVKVSGYNPAHLETAASEDIAEASSSTWFSTGLEGLGEKGGFLPVQSPVAQPLTSAEASVLKVSPEIVIIGQFGDAYILAQVDQTLFIVDQHAAHERILYHRLLKRDQDRQGGESQALMFPQLLQLSPLQVDLLQEQLPFFQGLGFELDMLGHNTVVIRAVPAGITGQEEATVLAMLEAPLPQDRDNWRRQAVINMACKQAIKAGQALNSSEMVGVMQDLLQTPDYKYCPHGRPTLIMISQQDLEHMFKR